MITQEERKIIKVLNDNPKAHVHYHDNMEWVIYKNRKDCELAMELDEEEAPKPLLGGSDFGSDYCPPIVTALMHMQGKTTSSI